MIATRISRKLTKSLTNTEQMFEILENINVIVITEESCIICNNS